MARHNHQQRGGVQARGRGKQMYRRNLSSRQQQEQTQPLRPTQRAPIVARPQPHFVKVLTLFSLYIVVQFLFDSPVFDKPLMLKLDCWEFPRHQHWRTQGLFGKQGKCFLPAGMCESVLLLLLWLLLFWFVILPFITV